MSGFDFSKMMPLYLDEVDELVAALNDALLKLEELPNDSALLQEAFRYAHTIKGSSTLMGFEQVKNLTHELETIFDQLRSKERKLDPAVLEIFFRCLDGLRDYHVELRTNDQSKVDLTGLTASVVAHLKSTSKGVTPAVGKPPAAAPAPLTRSHCLQVEFDPSMPLADIKAKLILKRLSAKATIDRTDPLSTVLDTSDAFDRLTIWLTSNTSIHELKALADVTGVVSIEMIEPSSPIIEPEPAIRDREPVASKPEAPPAPVVEEPAHETPVSKTKIGETIRVDIDRLDSLMNLAGELVINKSRFLQIAKGLEELFRGSNAHLLAADTQDRIESLGNAIESQTVGETVSEASIERWMVQFRGLSENFSAIHDELQKIRQGRERVNSLTEAIDQLMRVTDGIQKGVLNTRMVPIGPLFNRFRRVVRDLALSSGKEVTLELRGEKTELDKRMIDELGDPLIHMIRNSVDHGLETPEERLAAGKPRVGTISLAAAHRGNSVVILVSDDGRGIDVERIRKKIVSSGLVDADEASRLSERELIPYIWHPGLSTAERITDVSGRGVGMDIVKNRIEGLNGGIEVRTTLGQGTTMIVRLPLTLAIMPSLLVRIYDEVYAIPLDNVDEIIEVATDQIHRLHGKLAIETRKRVISLLRLGDVFRWGGNLHPTANGDVADRTKQLIVVVQNGETTIGLIVDELIGMQEVVLKSLEKNFRTVAGLSGASILGDGRVSLILDIDATIGMVTQANSGLNIGQLRI